MRRSAKAPVVDRDDIASDGYFCLVALILVTVASTAATIIGIGLALVG